MTAEHAVTLAALVRVLACRTKHLPSDLPPGVTILLPGPWATAVGLALPRPGLCGSTVRRYLRSAGYVAPGSRRGSDWHVTTTGLAAIAAVRNEKGAALWLSTPMQQRPQP